MRRARLLIYSHCHAHARVYYNVEIFKVNQPFALLIGLAAPPHELI